MVRLIFLSGVIVSVLAVASCKEESPCTDLSDYAQNIYILRDSIVYLHDSTIVVSDTISFLSISNSGGKYFINRFGPENVGIIAEGCAAGFKIDTTSEALVIYSGQGSITNNGDNIKLAVVQVPVYLFPSDTALYYCTGFKQ